MKNMAQLSAITYGYFVFLGFSYIIGFWITFNFNILEHIEIMDLFRFSTMGLMPAISSLLLGSLVGLFLATGSVIDSNNISYNNHSKNAQYADRFVRIISKFTVIIVILFSLPLLLNGLNFEKIYGLYPLASLLVFYLLSKNRDSLPINSNAGRAIFITVVSIAPSTALIHGRIGGLSSLYDTTSGYTVSDAAKCDTEKSDKYRYLSTVGGKVFSMSLSDKSICISKPESLKLQMHFPHGNKDDINSIPWWDEKFSIIRKVIKEY